MGGHPQAQVDVQVAAQVVGRAVHRCLRFFAVFQEAGGQHGAVVGGHGFVADQGQLAVESGVPGPLHYAQSRQRRPDDDKPSGAGGRGDCALRALTGQARTARIASSS